MMYIHYCQACHRIHILNGHKSICPTCERRLMELKISYMEYIELGLEERNQLKNKLKNPNHLTISKN
ncbi:MAG: hypothetical protein IKK03_02990 [Lachnospiraceae bacterium]|nr:hypothetical protein [Lachnospiraceae bacterium]MBR4058786.1 hypothetical protein [Lachnospiraceae bacterium]